MTSIYDYSECDEVADSIKASIPGFVPFKKLSEAVAFVRTRMGDQGEQIIENVAEALVDWPQPTPKAPIDGWGEW